MTKGEISRNERFHRLSHCFPTLFNIVMQSFIESFKNVVELKQKLSMWKRMKTNIATVNGTDRTLIVLFEEKQIKKRDINYQLP